MVALAPASCPTLFPARSNNAALLSSFPPSRSAVPIDASASPAAAAESVEEADALGADDYLKLCEQPVHSAKH